MIAILTDPGVHQNERVPLGVSLGADFDLDLVSGEGLDAQGSCSQRVGFALKVRAQPAKPDPLNRKFREEQRSFGKLYTRKCLVSEATIDFPLNMFP